MSENPYEIASFKLENGDEVSISYDIDAPSPLEDDNLARYFISKDLDIRAEDEEVETFDDYDFAEYEDSPVEYLKERRGAIEVRAFRLEEGGGGQLVIRYIPLDSELQDVGPLGSVELDAAGCWITRC